MQGGSGLPADFFVVSRDASEKTACSPQFVTVAGESLAAAAPLMRFLCSALSVPF
jgi:hypothetical protein